MTLIVHLARILILTCRYAAKCSRCLALLWNPVKTKARQISIWLPTQK